ncbi:MAG: M56 family metallopeptidase, partial [Phycisphaerae bacterium]
MTSAVEAINHAAGTWWAFVAHATWQSSLLAVIFLAVVRLGRRWPAQLRYALVVIALMKFAVPPTLSLPTGLFSRLGPVIVVDADKSAPGGLDHADEGPAAVTHALGAASWQSWLMLLHIAGAAAVAVYLAAQWAKVLAMARRAKAFARGPLRDRLAALCRRMGLRLPVRLLISPEPVSPMAFGVLRPSILVPASLFNDVSPRQMDTILAHELAHHGRGDILVNWCQAALTMLWWFNPVVWILNRAIRTAREDCCDDLLLARKLTTDGTYCRALLKVATGLRRSLLAAAVSGFAQRVHPLGDRIRRIMDPDLRRVPKLSFLTLVLMLAIAGVVLPGLRSGMGLRQQPPGSALI